MKFFTTTTLCIFLVQATLFAQMQHIPGELLVQIQPEANPESVLKNMAQSDWPGTELKLERQLSKPMNIFLVSFDPSAIDDRVLLQAFRQNRYVLNAQFNHIITQRSTFPNDPGLAQQWHHFNNGNNNGLEDADIDSELAWDITTGGTTSLGDTIVVCIIEGGNLLHPDLIGNAWFNHAEIPDNGIDDDSNGYVDDYRGWNVASNDDSGLYNGGHGTNVMGMIGASGDNEFGVVGANWNVKMMAVTGQSLNNEASVVAAYTYPLVQRQLYQTSGGQKGAFVVVTNASWGIDNGDPDDVPIWSAFYDTLGVYGILNCGATTNNNANIDEVGDIPTAVPSDYMISVTATNNNDIRTFSGYGVVNVDLGAPGQNVYTTSGTGGFTSTSGTSFASPLTAGVVALLYSIPCPSFASLAHSNPQAAADYIRFALFSGVDPVENLANETATGGRLNANNSLQILLNNCSEDVCLPPFGFNYQLSADTVYTFTWTFINEADSATIRYRTVGTEEWTYLVPETNTVIFDELAYCSSYEFQIANTCSEDISELNFSNSLIVNTQGCCENVEIVEMTSVGEDSIAIAWQNGFAIPAYEINYRVTGTTEWTWAGLSVDGTFVLNGLTACTYYDVQVKAACLDEAVLGTISTIRTKGCGICIDGEYCPGAGESTTFEFIQSVEIGSYTNNSGNNGGYVLFEETELDLALASTYSIVLTPGYSGQAYSEYFTTWIDFNQDGVFDESEVVQESSGGSNQPVVSEISIPADLLLGATRMRISMKYVGGPIVDDVLPCEIYEEGETEDYCVNIVDSITGIFEKHAANNLSIFPNPASYTAQINYNGIAPGLYRVVIFDVNGRLVSEQSVSNADQQIDLGELIPAIYMYAIMTIDGQIISSDKLVILR